MKTYPLFKVHVDQEAALKELAAVFESGYINEGSQVTALTEALQPILGSESLSLTNSCTSALVLALRLSGVGPGDEVISTAMTCVATNAAIASLGAKIVWADVDPEHGMLDPASLEYQLTSHSRAKAVVAVAWAGTPPDLKALGSVCREHGVRLILDAAHAFGAGYCRRPVHRWADFTCYSFQAIKHFTTGDGGALVCDSARDHARGKALKWFGLDRDHAKDAQGNWKGQQWDVDIEEIGYKFNMNNVAAAIGLSQLPHVSRILMKHRVNAALYDELLGADEMIRPVRRPAGAESAHWVYTVRLAPTPPTTSGRTRDELLRALNAEGIMAGVVHVPNDDYTCFQRHRFRMPGLRDFAARQFSLPCGWWMEADDIAHVARRVQELAR